MGAGILPTTIYKGKLYFLFGKENQFEDYQKGFSDFGGGTDNNESFLETAIREGSEEITGFLGSSNNIKQILLKTGTYHIDYKSDTHSTYRTHIFPFEYNDYLPYYYNNNQKFLQTHLDKKVYQKSKIFEKAEIKWFSIDELKHKRNQFRKFYRNIIDMILKEQHIIKQFINKSNKKKSNKNKFNKSNKNKYMRKTRKNK
jgi:8-oxo-dGTP pyrophosphatase MutT (NUDIX family)